jgi:hypothetical protein
MPPLQMPDWQTFPHEPQFEGSDRKSAQYVPPEPRQTWPRGQQNGLTPGGGMRMPGLLSATWPGGQQSCGSFERRSCGQQIASVPDLMPMLPGRIGIAHFVRGGQQTCFLPVTQQDRFFGQQPASPQQRDVCLLQHFFPHSSSFGWQRLQRPVAGFRQCHLGGQHLLSPHQAWPDGHRFTQMLTELRTRAVTHSSFGWQQKDPPPHTRSPCLQHRCRAGFAQNSPSSQHLPSPHDRLHGVLTGRQAAYPFGGALHSHEYLTVGVGFGQQIL